MESLGDILVSIFICVVLPVSIVLINAISKIKRDRLRTDVLIKAIEANNDLDADKLAEALKKPVKTAREILNQRLLRGCMFTLIGLFLGIIGMYNAANLDPDMVDDSATVPLIFGGLSLAVGISYLIVYFVSRKQVEAEVKK